MKRDEGEQPRRAAKAIGKGGQNVRLAAKLTAWRIDIKGDRVVDKQVLPESEKVFS